MTTKLSSHDQNEDFCKITLWNGNVGNKIIDKTFTIWFDLTTLHDSFSRDVRSRGRTKMI